VPRRNRKTGRISVFKGREARLNRAIIQVLGGKEPQTTRQLRKKITQIKGLNHTSYSTVNKRVRILERSGYLRKASVKQRPGGLTNYYELRPKAYLAKFLDSTNIENLFEKVNDQTALTILGALIDTKELNSRMEK
jgi:predicted transcriptional regulator